MWVRLPAAAFAAIAVLAGHDPLNDPSGGELLTTAHAQSRAQLKVQKLIDDLRGTSMPKGIAKTNGRIEATQIDVAAKYAGRLATVTVNEGDEVTAGQMSSSGEGSHLSALTDPDVTLSRHPALTLQPPAARLVPTRQIAWGPVARCVPASASTHVLGV
jgi:hypothetical protein